MLSSLFLVSCLAGAIVAQSVDVDAKKQTTSSTSTTATTVPTACSATVNSATPTGIPCGKSGTLTGYPAYFGGAFGEVNRDACAAVCATLDGCTSFAYNQDQNTCQLFSETLKAMGFKASKGDDGLDYYGLGCFGCAPMPTTVSTTSTSAPSTSASSSTLVTSITPLSTGSSTTLISSTTTASPTSTSTTPSPTSASTTSIDSTTTTAPAGTMTVCTSTAVTVTAGGYTDTYTSFYAAPTGGFTENPVNPGNRTHPSVTSELTDSDACSAIADCAKLADTATTSSSGSTLFYKSFDVHYVETTGEWECVTYFGYQTNGSYFNVANATIGQAYGFST